MNVKLLRYTKDGIKLVADSCRVSGLPPTMSNEEIVRMVVENDYSSALEHISFTFDIQGISLALSRELLEHRISSHTARSTRYNEETGFNYYTPIEFNKKRNSKQKKYFEDVMKQLSNTYAELRKMGISRESARYVLPLSTHTNYIFTINARSLLNFLGLRLCVRASPEIKELAKKMHETVVKIYPEIFKNIDCRGWNLSACPENKVRESTNCPYKRKIPTKEEVRESWGS
jgi:thymidylate synthase (FAD)